MPDQPHRYTITPHDPGAHLYRVTLTVAEPDPHGQQFAIPAWIPGSYMIRDYARHVVAIQAEANGEELELLPLDKSRWQAAPADGPLTLVAEIHAFDASVRGAHLDTTHAYFNGPCMFPSVMGQERRAVELEICPPPTGIGRHWRVATSMRRKDAPVYGYGTYTADDYDELIDHPVEIGDLLIGEFEAGGIPHVIAIRGNPPVDMGRLCRDLSTLCTQHLSFLGPPAGLDRYVFLLQVVTDGYGGLEHRWSSSLVCSPNELPPRGDTRIGSGYRRFLGLCSHEYFHLWNVKRMKPAAFTPFDLQSETHTGLLWVFEGITSYYDDLMLLRAGLITVDSYLELLGQLITRVQRTHGRFRQSVEESSFYAWTKFYKQDANAGNAIVSYYAKGALIALALDLTLRHGTDNRYSLDDVMHECWKRYGESGEGMPERGLESVAAELSGMELGDFFARYVRGTADLPLAQLLRDSGVNLHLRPAVATGDAGGGPAPPGSRPLPWMGARLEGTGGGSVIRAVQAGSPAERAGLAPEDVPVAFDNVRLTAANLDQHLGMHFAGDQVVVSVFRRDTLLSFKVKLEAPPDDTAYLTLQDDCNAVAERQRNAWLGISG